MANKSVLDGIQVKEQGFPLSQSQGSFLPVVSSCPQCGAPIHGKRLLHPGDDPEVRFTCDCRNQRKTIQDVMQTK